MAGYTPTTPRHDGGRAVSNSIWHIELYEDLFNRVRVDVTQAGTTKSPEAILMCTKFPIGWRLGPVPDRLPSTVGVEARKLMATLP